MAFEYCAIKDLTPQLNQVSVIGLIIAKTSPRTFPSQKDSGERGVINITLRDENRSTVNCSIWSSRNFIESFDTYHKIGDVITISKAKVITKKSSSENFNPLTYSPYELVYNESASKITRVEGERRANLMALEHEIFKPTVRAMRLNDFVSQGSRAVTMLADFVVAVRAVQSPTTISTKFGLRDLQKIIIMDDSHAEVVLKIWGGAYIQLAAEWIPYRTILHLVDVQVIYSKYDAAVTLSIVGRTVIIVNPNNSSRATALQHHVDEKAYMLPAVAEHSSKAKVDVAAIVDVKSIQQVIVLLQAAAEESEILPFNAVLYAIITKMNLDVTSQTGPISKFCRICNKFIKRNNRMCDDPNCGNRLALEGGHTYVERFNITVDLCDHSGVLKNCRLRDEYAANVIGYDTWSFAHLTEADIDRLDDKFLLERFAVKIVCNGEPRPIIQIVDCVPFQYSSDATKLKA